MRHLDLFSGIGGFALAAEWVWGEDHEVVAFCDNNKFCQQVLKKQWPGVRIFEDIKKLTVLPTNDKISPCESNQKNIIKQLRCMNRECLLGTWQDIIELLAKLCTKFSKEEGRSLDQICDMGQKTTFIEGQKQAIERKTYLKKPSKKELSKEKLIAKIAETLEHSKTDGQRYRHIIQIILNHSKLNGSAKNVIINGTKKIKQKRQNSEAATGGAMQIDLLTGGFP